jgi:uncharacterized membrane protein YcfT
MLCKNDNSLTKTVKGAIIPVIKDKAYRDYVLVRVNMYSDSRRDFPGWIVYLRTLTLFVKAPAWYIFTLRCHCVTLYNI